MLQAIVIPLDGPENDLEKNRNKAMIEICNITKKYDDFTCLEQVSLTIPDGTVYGLVGENGAGKSTLIRLIAGVYKADSGEIRIDGKKLPDIKAKQEIFYMPDTQYYEKNATALTIGDFYKTFYPGFEMEDYRYLLEQFGLEENAFVDSFSKGMKKQMFIAAAICANTKYLFCDEVFDGLDPQIRNTVNELLKSVVAGRKMTILVVSHYLEELGKICTDRGFLHRGRILPESVWEEMVSKNNEQAESFNAEKEGQQG